MRLPHKHVQSIFLCFCDRCKQWNKNDHGSISLDKHSDDQKENIFLGLLYKEMHIKDMIQGLKETACTTTSIMLIVSAASPMIMIGSKSGKIAGLNAFQKRDHVIFSVEMLPYPRFFEITPTNNHHGDAEQCPNPDLT